MCIKVNVLKILISCPPEILKDITVDGCRFAGCFRPSNRCWLESQCGRSRCFRQRCAKPQDDLWGWNATMTGGCELSRSFGDLARQPLDWQLPEAVDWRLDSVYLYDTYCNFLNFGTPCDIMFNCVSNLPLLSCDSPPSLFCSVQLQGTSIHYSSCCRNVWTLDIRPFWPLHCSKWGPHPPLAGNWSNWTFWSGSQGDTWELGLRFFWSLNSRPRNLQS